MKKKLKFVVIGLAIIVVVLIGVLCYVNTGIFLKAHVLPVVAEQLKMPVTAKQANFTLWKQVQFENLVVGQPDAPLLAIDSLNVQYQGFAILSKQVVVDEITVKGVRVLADDAKIAHLQETFASPAETEAPAKESSPSSGELPVQLDVRNINLADIKLVYDSESQGVKASIADLKVQIPALKPGAPFELTIETACSAAIRDLGELSNMGVAVNIAGELAKDLLPTALKITATGDQMAGTVAGVDMDGRALTAAVEFTSQDGGYVLEKCELRESHNGRSELAADLTGTINLEPLDAKLAYKCDLAGNGVLDVVGGVLGDYRFGDTAVTCKGNVALDAKEVATASGELSVTALTIASESLGLTPLNPLQVRMAHDLQFGLASGDLAVQTFMLKVADEKASRDIVDVTLDKPIELNLNSPQGQGNATLAIRVNALDLAMAKPLIPPNEAFAFHGGSLNSELTVDVKNGGKLATVSGFAQVNDLAFAAAGHSFSDLQIRQNLAVTAEEFSQFALNTVETLIRKGEATPFLSVSLGGSAALKPEKLDVSAELTLTGDDFHELAEAFATGWSIGNTRIQYRGDVTGDLKNIALDGSLAVTDVTMTSESLGIAALAPMTVTSKHKVQWQQDAQKLSLASLELLTKLGRSDILGVTLKQPFTVTVDELNAGKSGALSILCEIRNLQLGQLAAAIPPSVGMNTLNGQVAGRYEIAAHNLGSALTVSGETTVDALELAMATGALSAPVSLSVKTKAGFTDFKTLGLEDLSLALAVAGQTIDVQASGTLMVPPGAERSHIKVSLPNPVDVEPLLSIYQPGTVQPGPGGATETEPAADDAVSPLADLWVEFEAAVSKLTYRGIAVSDIELAARLKEETLSVTPCKLQLNGEPVSVTAEANLKNLSNPAFDVTVATGAIDFRPFIDAFVSTPVEIHGGLKSVNLTAKGEGIDMPALEKSLAADVKFELASLSLTGLQKNAKWYTTAISLIIIEKLGVSWEEMTFGEGNGHIRVADKQVHVDEFALAGHELHMNLNGNVEFGGDWLPDLVLTPSFSGGLQRRVARNRVPLTETKREGFQAAPGIDLEGPIWEAKHLTLHTVRTYAGKLDATIGGANEVLDGLGSIKKDPKKGLIKAIGGGLKIWADQEKRKQEPEPQAPDDGGQQEAPPKKTEDAPAKNVNDLIDLFR